MGFGSILKKATSTVVSAASGFVAGGNVGGVAGLARGVIKNTKTSEAAPTTLKSVGADFVTGGAANIVAGGFAALPHILGPAASGTGGAMTKAVAFGKSGGFVGNFGNILKGGANAVGKAAQVFSGLKLFNQGATTVPGTSETPASITAENANVVDKVRSAYRNLSPGITDKVKGITENITEKGIGSNTLDEIKGLVLAGNNPPQAGAVNISAPDSGSNKMLLAGAALLALFWISKKKA